MRYFPIFTDLRQRTVIVAGGGEEALRKVRLLLKSEARIAVIAPALHPELAGNPRIDWLAREFRPGLLDGAALVFAADPSHNDAVAAAARVRGIPVNAVDAPALSSFIVPAIVDRDPVVVAIGTEGTAPVLCQGIRARIDALLPARLGELARAAGALRAQAASVPHGNRRRSFWLRYFFGAIGQSFLAGNRIAYARELDVALRDATAPARGSVSVLGAASSDPELLTLKAQRKLHEADLIVHDIEVAPAILEVARRDATRMAASRDSAATVIAAARAGEHVVRLSAGDVSAFGRGAEVAAYLAAGLAVDVVPAIAAPPGPGRRSRSDVVAFPERNEARDTLLRAAS